MDRGTFETLVPSRFIAFIFPNPNLLRVAVLDSPLPPATHPPLVAAMLVPDGRETDWIFSTESGHFQLLFQEPNISRLILIGNFPGSDFLVSYNRAIRNDEQALLTLEERLKPLLFALSPKSFILEKISSDIPFLVYEDYLISSVVVERCIGPCVGEMLVEDVEIDCMGLDRPEFLRRLRFKRTPNLVQTQMRLIPHDSSSTGVEDRRFELDMRALVHPYLAPMVGSLSLIGTYIEECFQSGVKPRSLCIGVGGGALLGFLRTQLGFKVDGIEEDEVVLKIARRYFGLGNEPTIIGDGLEFLKNIAEQLNSGHNSESTTKYDVIMVDLDSSDSRNGITAPPLEFVNETILLAARMALSKLGILVLNVIPLSRQFYENLIQVFQGIFEEVYQIVVDNEDNFVLVASVSSIDINMCRSDNYFLSRLKQIIPNKYMDTITKL